MNISKKEAKEKYPLINFDDINEIYFEKRAGALMASRCCKQVVRKFKKNGGKVFLGEVKIDEKNLDKKSSITINGNIIEADKFVIACGPWNRKLFPEMLEDTTYISRQEVYYFGVPNNKAHEYNLNKIPCWLDLLADCQAASPGMCGPNLCLSRSCGGNKSPANSSRRC